MSKHTPQSSQPELPSPKLCECGCGQPTPVAVRNDKRHGHVKGQPTRFARGHSRRCHPPTEGGNPSGLCMCGCGQPTALAKQNDTKMGYVQGKPVHFLPGHSQGIRLAIASRTKHGMSSTKDYKYWLSIKRRCYGSREISYKNYGGRGIKMHESWVNDFLAFNAYVTQLPNYGIKGYSLDRIDNNGDYEPGNVRWVDRLAQSNNTRLNRYIEFHGEIHTSTEWGRILNISGDVINQRIRNGWTTEKALTTPVQVHSSTKPGHVSS